MLQFILGIVEWGQYPKNSYGKSGLFLYNESMKKEQLISISIRNMRHFFKASWLATQTETRGGAKTKGEVPDGKITDYHATIETTLTFKDGQLAGSPQAQDTKIFNKPLEKPETPLKPAPQPKPHEPAPHTKMGKTFTTHFSERIFYINGRETARQTLDFDGNIIESSGEAFTGNAKDFYQGGMLKQEAYFNKGIMEGAVKTYDKSGRLISEENYKNGLKEGKAVVYNFTNGIVNEQHLEYSKGKLNGARRAYNAAGTLMGIEHFKDGKRNGVREIFYSTGKIQNSANYVNDAMEGERISYYENGDILYKEDFVQGRLHGKRRGFYPGGKKYLEENYNNDMLDGARVIYGEDGKVKLRQLYIDGVLQP